MQYQENKLQKYLLIIKIVKYRINKDQMILVRFLVSIDEALDYNVTIQREFYSDDRVRLSQTLMCQRHIFSRQFLSSFRNKTGDRCPRHHPAKQMLQKNLLLSDVKKLIIKHTI